MAKKKTGSSQAVKVNPNQKNTTERPVITKQRYSKEEKK